MIEGLLFVIIFLLVIIAGLLCHIVDHQHGIFEEDDY